MVSRTGSRTGFALVLAAVVAAGACSINPTEREAEAIAREAEAIAEEITPEYCDAVKSNRETLTRGVSGGLAEAWEATLPDASGARLRHEVEEFVSGLRAAAREEPPATSFSASSEALVSAIQQKCDIALPATEVAGVVPEGEGE